MSSTDLSQYYRRVKKYVTLPSGHSYYHDDVIHFTDDGEVGIRSMTSDDEIALKNPETLLNGEGIRSVLLSCVDGLKKPDSILTNDIDVLLTAIRSASYGHSEYTSECSECGHENHFALDSDQIIEASTKLDPEYTIETSSGLTMYIRPFTYSDRVKLMRVAFEQEKIRTQMLSTDSPDASLKIMSRSLKDITTMNTQLICNSVYRLVDMSRGLDMQVTADTAKDVYDLLHNLETADATKIDEKLKIINNIGIDKKIDITCSECGFSWEASYETNPVNFSLGS